MFMSGKIRNILVKTVVNLCRMALAATFIFSGFVKANDPYGMAYKLHDYFAAFGMSETPQFIVLAMAVAIGAIEFTMGIYLLFGISRSAISKLVLTFMSFMTLLTVYIYIYDPVKDCGCFGDAVVLTNLETLLKNIVLLGAAIVVAKKPKYQIEFISPNTAWLISLYAVVFVLGFSVYCIRNLPFIDYRPFHIGADIRQGVELPDSLMPVYEARIVYERNGERLELLPEDDDPDSTWTYVETTRKLVKAGGVPDIQNLYMQEPQADYDLSEAILGDEGYTFLLIAPRLEFADDSNVDLINEAYDYAMANGYAFYCLTSSDSIARSYWTEHTGAEYSFLLGDEQTLKTIVRSNPGLVLMHDGVIVNKWSSFDLPDEYELNGKLEDIPAGKISYVSMNHKVAYVFMLFFLPLFVLTLLDRMAMGWSFYRRMKRKTEELNLDEIEKNIHNTFNSKNKEKNEKENRSRQLEDES